MATTWDDDRASGATAGLVRTTWMAAAGGGAILAAGFLMGLADTAFGFLMLAVASGVAAVAAAARRTNEAGMARVAVEVVAAVVLTAVIALALIFIAAVVGVS